MTLKRIGLNIKQRNGDGKTTNHENVRGGFLVLKIKGEDNADMCNVISDWTDIAIAHGILVFLVVGGCVLYDPCVCQYL